MKNTLFNLALLLTALSGLSQTWGSAGLVLPSNYNIYSITQFHNKLYVGGLWGMYSFDGNSWKISPKPYVSFVYSLTEFNDTLYSSGDVGNNVILHVFKFDGTTQIQVPGDFYGQNWTAIYNLLNFNGQLIAAGHFNQINGLPIFNIASYDGNSWQPLGKGLAGDTYDRVSYLAEHKGQLFAAGDFTNSGGDTTVNHIAKWNGTKWTPLDSTRNIKSKVGPMISYNNTLIICNIRDTIKGVPMRGIASWNGDTFISMGNNLIGNVRNFWIFKNEMYLCGGIFNLNPYFQDNVVLKWNGVFWEKVGQNFDDQVIAFAEYNNHLYCGGIFNTPSTPIAKLNPSVGILESDAPVNLKLLPNPATNQFTMATNEPGTLTIINELGEIVYSQIIIAEAQINTTKYVKGVYFVTLKTDKQILKTKLIIH